MDKIFVPVALITASSTICKGSPGTLKSACHNEMFDVILGTASGRPGTMFTIYSLSTKERARKKAYAC